MLSNTEALKVFLDAYHKFQNYEIILGLDLRIIASYENISAKVNLSYKDFLGKHLIRDFRHDVKLADSGVQLLEKVIRNKADMQVLSINFLRHKEDIILLIDYTPIVNQSTGDVIAVGIKMHTVLYPMLWHKLFIAEDTYEHIPLAEIIEQVDENGLTTIEQEIGFLIFNCDNYTEIAQILSWCHNKKFTKSWVTKLIVQKLWIKFKVYNLKSLKQKLLEKGYHKTVPASLIGETVIEVSKF